MLAALVTLIAAYSVPSAFAGQPDFGSWPGLKSLSFTTPDPLVATFTTPEPLTITFGSVEETKKMLDGKKNTECKLESDPNNIDDLDILDNIGIYKGKYDGSCYPWDNTSYSDFLTEKGRLGDGSGKTYEAYKIHHPAVPPTSSWQYGIVKLLFKVEGTLASSYIIYKAQPRTSGEAYELSIAQKDIVPVASGQFVMTSVEITGDNFDAVSDPPIFFVLPEDEALNAPETKTLSGKRNTECDLDTDPDDVDIRDTLGDIGLYKGKHSDRSCYTYDSTSYSDFLTERGELGDGSGKTYDAYKIHYPLKKPTNFQAGITKLLIKVEGTLASSYIIYKAQPRSEGDDYTITIAQKGVVPAASGKFIMTDVEITGDDFDALPDDPPIFFVLPEDEALNIPIYKTLPGTVTECALNEDITNIDPGYIFEDIAIYKGAGSDGDCTSSGVYSYSNFLVEMGELDVGSGNTYVAYKVHYPENIPTSYQYGTSKVMFKVDGPLASGYTVYKIQLPLSEGGDFTVTVPDKGVKAKKKNQFFMTDALAAPPGKGVAAGGVPAIYVVVPDDEPMPVWPELPSTTEVVQAKVFSEDKVALYAEVLGLDLDKGPFDPNVDYHTGLGEHAHKYGFRKVYFPVTNSNDGMMGVVWQDQTSWLIYVTWFKDSSQLTYKLPRNINGSNYLVSAVGDDATGNIVYALMDRTHDGDDSFSELTVKVVKVTNDGTLIKSRTLDTSKDGIDVHEFFSSGTSMAWNHSENLIGWMLSRTMTPSSDGNNHQACLIVLIDPDTLKVLSGRQTSSHSWNNFVTSSGDGFLAVDLGDAFPRGVHVHRVTETKMSGHVVYNFKTKHATNARGPNGKIFPVYEEISNDDVTYYKYSNNDNGVYTEIAQPSLLELANDEIMVVFVGEFPSLDNSQVGADVNRPRNIGVVKVSATDFSNVLSDGPDSIGGYYDFLGTWKEQVNEGIIQLTDFTPNETNADLWDGATRVKTAKISSSQFGMSSVDEELLVILYEVWSLVTYKRTEYMVIDSAGEIVVPPTVIPVVLRLAPHDPVEVQYDNTVSFYGTDGGGLIRYHLKFGGDAPPPETSEPSATPTASPSILPTAESGTSAPSGTPTASPSATSSMEPTAGEDPVCADSPLKVQFGKKKVPKPCSKMKKANCRTKLAKSHCPVKCKACDSFEFVDSTGTFMYEKEPKTCDWVGDQVAEKPEKLLDLCAPGSDISKTCRKTCAIANLRTCEA